MCEEKIDDDATSSEFAGSFMFWIEEHAEKSWEKGTLNLTQLLQSEISRAKSLKAEQCFVEEAILMFLSVSELAPNDSY